MSSAQAFIQDGAIYIYNPGTLSLEIWTGAITFGSVTIGAVDQGTGGTSAWKVDGSAVTQPVSGTFWQATQPVSGTVTANAGSNLNTSALALDASISTLNTSVNTLLKPANTLTAVTTVGAVTSITNPVAVTSATFATAANQTTELASLSSIDTKLTSQATAANQATEIASLAAIDSNTDALTLAQGASGASTVGPMIQGVVNDTPAIYLNDELRPLSLTPEGRLRVSTYPASVDQVWQGTFDNPWDFSYPSGADSATPHGALTYV